MQTQLTNEQLMRYGKQLKLAGMTVESQSKLLHSRVLILGVNNTGAIASQSLAAAGVGSIGLMDNGVVEQSHLNNLPFCTPADLGRSSIETIKNAILTYNPDVRTIMHAQRFDAHTAESILPQYEVVVDGLDSWQDKLLASDLCMRLNKPFIHAGCLGFRIQIYSMLPGKSACLRCVFSQTGLEDTVRISSESSCFGPAVGIAGLLQATETIKLIAKLGIVPSDQLTQFDTLRNEFSSVLELSARFDCPDCGAAMKRRNGN